MSKPKPVPDSGAPSRLFDLRIPDAYREAEEAVARREAADHRDAERKKQTDRVLLDKYPSLED